ncbi:hypothetical protein JVU11DRAFT_11342 [Chiua virens]|nr:hypothetical protein JVU11DRAFT_11342 [Chiua virens]
MMKPNPPPDENDRKRVWQVENASSALLRPFMTGFSLAPGIVEFTTLLVRLVAPPSYDIVSGTCADRITFHPLPLVAAVLGLFGMGIRLWCYRALGPYFTFELALLPGHKLVTTGPYAFIRHPAYTGGLLALVGMTLANISNGSWAYECGYVLSWWGLGWGSVAGISTIVIVERCLREDKLLREAFGEEWDTWSRQVRWRMIPWVY